VRFKRETEFQDTEIGKIPKEWKVVKLKDIATKIKMGGTPKRTVKEYWNGEIPFAKIEDITNSGKYLLSTSSTITRLGLENSNAWLVPMNSLLITIYGTLGMVIINKIEVATNQAIVGVIPKRELVDVEFLYYWYLYYQPNWIKFVKKSTQPNLTLEIVANSKLPLPSLAEQKVIAEILSTVDRAIEVVDAGVVRLEGLKKALMRELLTGRIRVREENGKLVFNKETDFQETEIGKIPREWRVKKLGELVFEIYYGLTAKAVDQPTELRMLRTTDIKDNYRVDWDSLPYCEITDNRRSNIQKYLLRKNDLVVSRAGTTGMSILVDKDLNDVIFGSYLIKIKLNESVAYPKFIHYFMQSSLYWNQLLPKQAGSTLKNISLPILKNILTPLPPINEQKLIPEILSTLDRTIELYHEERIRLERLKRGLMDLLLTGKIRVVEG
jgi:type I restriction enzyme S subunit